MCLDKKCQVYLLAGESKTHDDLPWREQRWRVGSYVKVEQALHRMHKIASSPGQDSSDARLIRSITSLVAY